MIEVRPATSADIVAFYGAPHERTLRAWVVVLDGGVVALGGVFYHRSQPQCLFGEVRPEGRRLRKTLVSICRMALAQIKIPVHAVADPKLPMAPKLLRHLGLESVGPTDLGELFIWRGHS